MDGSPVHYAAWAQGERNFAHAHKNCVVLNKKHGELHKTLKNIFMGTALPLFVKNILPTLIHSFPAILENLHTKV